MLTYPQKDSRSVDFVILFALALIAFGRLSAFPFVYDDILVLRDNDLLRSLSGLREIWRGHVDHAHEMDGVFRPLFLSFLWIQRAIGNGSPVPFRLVSILLHAFNALLLMEVSRRLFRLPRMLSVIAPIVFLLHPIQVTGLNLAWKQSDLWIAASVLGSLLLMERGRIWGAISIFFAALFIKESAVVIPWFWLLAEPLFPSEKRMQRLGSSAASGLISILWLSLLLPLVPGPITPGETPPGRWTYFLTQVSVIPLYAKALVLPGSLTIDRTIDPSNGKFVSALFRDLFFFFALLIELWCWLIWKSKRMILPCLFAIVWLFPTSSFQPLALAYDETRVYLAIGFLALSLVVVFEKVSPSLKIDNKISWAALSAVCFALILATLQQTGRFQSEKALWSSALQVDPRTARANYSLGLLAQNERALKEAAHHYRAALAVSPSLYNARINLGITLGRMGNLDEAAQEFSILTQGPPHAAALGHYHLGLDAMYRKEPLKAASHFEECRRLRPMTGIAYKGEAILFESYHQNRRAIEAWEKYLETPTLSRDERLTAIRSLERLAAPPPVR